MTDTSNYILEDSILKDLACPRCHGELGYILSRLICAHCKLHYPIEDGILVLMEDCAEIQLS